MHVQELIEDSLVMTLPEIRDALKKLALEQRLICEGAAAASLAATLRLGSQNPEMEIACVLTGGNISPEIFKEILYD